MHQSSTHIDVVDICWKVLDLFHFSSGISMVVNQVDYHHLHCHHHHHEMVACVPDLYCLLDQLHRRPSASPSFQYLVLFHLQ
jgi:hypothetical protein